MSSTVIAMAIKEHRRSPQANIYVMEILPSPAEHIPETHRQLTRIQQRQHCMYTLLQELKRSGPDNPALSMLVEPLFPRAWMKELDQQKLLKGDEDTEALLRRICKAPSTRKGRP
ncbi:hypothetical protein WJX77_009250 [Trebouxia sp. C0004]